ncbi:bacillithiol biosynthesis cysteine-adding enzyme BshC [Flavicella sediminum]|uniref:bacillithiol biosynthesis cysteine-adding enzyme BshC n=1 Tax=Flavicella sediminum TaxID=2585141 RepID=UPI001122D23A|nr:bacillithiol biosynthesis cysteine-adding enzyme BshC [Flavicella sediminum]
MQHTQIPFQNTGYISKLICDYVSKNPKLDGLYGEFPDLVGFKKQIALKESQFPFESRKILVESLQTQFSKLQVTKQTQENIEALALKNTFTVVTGHQLNLFTGPLYFLYKIVSAINLAKQLKAEFPQQNFVPVYWMATEDHDFEEINHFFVKNTKIEWDVESSGPVGIHSTKGLDTAFEEFSKEIGSSKNANYLKELFRKGYLEHDNLTEATRYIVNELFGAHGLVIVDGDDKQLKQLFTPYAKNELLDNVAINSLQITNAFLEENYKVQVNPRDINLFYIKDGLRERIIFEDELFKINNTAITLTKTEILEELNKHPEYFSPNVIMRPLYQEVVLPNLCYIGGGGEIAYWLQLKAMFDKVAVPFPILLVRNSVLLINEKQARKAKKLEIKIEELFLKQEALVNTKTKELSELTIDFSAQKETLAKLFSDLKPLVSQTNKTFEGALLAQEKKQLKGFLNLEKRLLKAEKKNLQDKLSRITQIQNELFPRQGLQERNVNFAEFYIEHGQELIPILLQELDPLSLQFSVISL